MYLGISLAVAISAALWVHLRLKQHWGQMGKPQPVLNNLALVAVSFSGLFAFGAFLGLALDRLGIPFDMSGKMFAQNPGDPEMDKKLWAFSRWYLLAFVSVCIVSAAFPALFRFRPAAPSLLTLTSAQTWLVSMPLFLLVFMPAEGIVHAHAPGATTVCVLAGVALLAGTAFGARRWAGKVFDGLVARRLSELGLRERGPWVPGDYDASDAVLFRPLLNAHNRVRRRQIVDHDSNSSGFYRPASRLSSADFDVELEKGQWLPVESMQFDLRLDAVMDRSKYLLRPDLGSKG